MDPVKELYYRCLSPPRCGVLSPLVEGRDEDEVGACKTNNKNTKRAHKMWEDM